MASVCIVTPVPVLYVTAVCACVCVCVCADGSSGLWRGRTSTVGQSAFTWLGHNAGATLHGEASHHHKRVTDSSQLLRIHGNYSCVFLYVKVKVKSSILRSLKTEDEVCHMLLVCLHLTYSSAKRKFRVHFADNFSSTVLCINLKLLLHVKVYNCVSFR